MLQAAWCVLSVAKAIEDKWEATFHLFQIVSRLFTDMLTFSDFLSLGGLFRCQQELWAAPGTAIQSAAMKILKTSYNGTN